MKVTLSQFNFKSIPFSRLQICKSMYFPGWSGLQCQDMCDPYHFGRDCSKTCNCSATGERCYHVTGDCLQCPSGTFGPNCDRNCSCNANGTALCYHLNGKNSQLGNICTSIFYARVMKVQKHGFFIGILGFYKAGMGLKSEVVWTN